MLATVYAWDELPKVLARSGLKKDSLLATLAVRGSNPWAAWVLAGQAAEATRRGEIEPAICYLRASTALNEQSLFYPARLAIFLAQARRCSEAEQALSTALDRLQERQSPSVRRVDEQSTKRVWP